MLEFDIRNMDKSDWYSTDNINKVLFDELVDAIEKGDKPREKLLFYVTYDFLYYLLGSPVQKAEQKSEQESEPKQINLSIDNMLTKAGQKINQMGGRLTLNDEDKEKIKLVVEEYKKAYGLIEKPAESQYPKEVVGDIYTKAENIISKFTLADNFLKFTYIPFFDGKPKDLDKIKRLIEVLAKHRHDISEGFGLLLSTGYTPSQFYGGLLLIDKGGYESTNTSFSTKFLSELKAGTVLYFTPKRFGFNSKLVEIIINAMKMDLMYDPDINTMAQNLSNKFILMDIKKQSYEQIIQILKISNMLSEQNMNKLTKLMDEINKAMKLASGIFAKSNENVQIPESKYNAEDKQKVINEVVESYKHSNYIRPGQTPVGVIITSDKWEYQKINKGTYRQDFNFKDRIHVNQWTEEYYTIPGYIILDSSYDFYELDGILIRANIETVKGEGAEPKKIMGKAFVYSLIQDSTIYVPKNKIKIDQQLTTSTANK